MTRHEYLDALCMHLSGLSQKEKQEILLDFQEHFSAGLAQGKTEDEISNDLGSPEFAAQQYLGEEKGTGAAPPVAPQPPHFGNAPIPPTPNRPAHLQGNPDKTLYTVLLVLILIFLALPGYPTAIAFFIAFFALLVGGIFTAIVSSSVPLGLLLVSIGGIFLSLGGLIFIGLTAALRACTRNMK